MTRGHCVCGRLAPTNGEDHTDGDWFRVDLDGPAGPIEPLWICPNHRDETDAEIAVWLHRAILRGAVV